MNMRRGYIALFRSIEESWIWKQSGDRFRAWLSILLRSSYKPGVVTINGKEMELHRGDFLASFSTLAERWRMNISSVQRFLVTLEKNGMITKKKFEGVPIYTVTNYEKYQDFTRIGDRIGEEKNRTGTRTGNRTGIVADESEFMDMPEQAPEQATEQASQKTEQATDYILNNPETILTRETIKSRSIPTEYLFSGAENDVDKNVENSKKTPRKINPGLSAWKKFFPDWWENHVWQKTAIATAEKAWEKAGKAGKFETEDQAVETYAMIVRATDEYREYLAMPGARWPCNPSTWLNQKRWGDDLSALKAEAEKRSKTKGQIEFQKKVEMFKNMKLD